MSTQVPWSAMGTKPGSSGGCVERHIENLNVEVNDSGDMCHPVYFTNCQIENLNVFVKDSEGLNGYQAVAQPAKGRVGPYVEGKRPTLRAVPSNSSCGSIPGLPSQQMSSPATSPKKDDSGLGTAVPAPGVRLTVKAGMTAKEMDDVWRQQHERAEMEAVQSQTISHMTQSEKGKSTSSWEGLLVGESQSLGESPDLGILASNAAVKPKTLDEEVSKFGWARLGVDVDVGAVDSGGAHPEGSIAEEGSAVGVDFDNQLDLLAAKAGRN